MIRLLIADDQAVVRTGLAVILGAEDDIEVVGQAEDGRQAVQLARSLQPDVVCMDIRMPVMDGIAATREITADPDLDVDVLMLTTFDVDDDVFAALDAGAAGFLLKGADEATLAGAVRSVAAGEGTLDQRLTRRILHEFVATRRTAPAPRPQPAVPAPLTDREVDVLRLLAEGLSNAEIAGRLFVEPTTVKYHLAGLLQKTASRDRLQAVLWGIRTGLVQPG
ncbi:MULTISPECIES: response regulator transcription factor [unclassified Microbacterium]|uniref:response regulator transcription factor n=1 Tax=unclassified Microbacterium TaxID=2609290 RepID=UPI00214AAA8C|nr:MULTISPECIES: response regulator transcription factor [unclassified Microbacterium]MCR2800976.1 response regulator transcription factor [Microbacterium sp. zg.Y818]MCR2824936.1 response regulator transcription factor [Microbacterium sp. zg.Y909]WIM23682.1 response regulator transcription factor [Microbacterium sp. zg-Y818]